MELDEALRHALDGCATLFLGAGYSIGATSLQGAKVPGGRELSSLLAQEVGHSDEIQLDISSSMYVDKYGEHAVIDLIKEKFIVGNILEHQKIFASLPWKRVYTTNYDNVFEAACEELGIKCASYDAKDNPNDISRSRVACIHINGMATTLSHGDIGDKFKLTNTSYAAESFERSTWSRLFFQDIETSRAVIFLGYSLYDIDVQRILYATSELKKKCIFIVSEEEDSIRDHVLGKYGSVLSVGVDFSADVLEYESNNYVGVESSEPFYCFNKLDLPDSNGSPATSRETFDMFVIGKADKRLVYNSLAGREGNYYIPRKQIHTVASVLNENKKAVVVHSYLGNGKSFFVYGVSLLLRSEGWDVFYYSRDRDTLLKESIRLRESSSKTLIVFDDYVSKLNVLKDINVSCNENVKFLLSSRTPQHLRAWADIKELFGEGSVFEMPVDRLCFDEIRTLDGIMTRSGLYGRYAAENSDQRVRNIKNKCDSQFKEFLLEFFNSRDMKERIYDVFTSVKDFDVRKCIIAALVLGHINIKSDVDVLAELVGVDSVNRVFLSNDESVSELVAYDRDEMFPRSTVFSTFALRHFWEEGVVSSVIVEMVRRALELRFDEKVYQDISRELMRFGAIRALLPDEGFGEKIVSYYESIKNFNGCYNNQLFWLQFAIARIHLKEFELAERYLETAYSLSKKSHGFNTFQIDTTFARLKMMRCIERGGDGADTFGRFREVHQLITKQMGNDEFSYYPYRVAALYGEFWGRVVSYWPDDQKKIFLKGCNFILSSVDRVHESLKNHPDVQRCRASLWEVVERVGVQKFQSLVE